VRLTAGNLTVPAKPGAMRPLRSVRAKMGAVEVTSRRALAWHAIDLRDPAPADRFVAPENHWPAFSALPLSLEQRHGMNNLALRFSCEMVAHFERYIVDYLEHHSARLGGALTPRAIRVFASDERVHIEGFLRLLAVLRPAAYREPRLAFFHWSFWDRLVVRWSPAITFFVATDLLEEMFLHLHTVMEQQPDQSLPAAREVMALHARDERSHLAMDDLVIRKRGARKWRPWVALQAFACLLILIVVDRKTKRAWKRAVRAEASELGLSRRETRALARKQLSVSDVIGMRAFITRRRDRPFPGSRLLCWVLARTLPKS
jgi:hypothetical protein